MKGVLTFLYNLLTSMSPTVQAVLGVFTVFLAINAYVNLLWASLFSRVDALVGATIGATDFTGLALVNYLFPLDTMFSLLTTYAALYVACASIRIVKSFIPTIS